MKCGLSLSTQDHIIQHIFQLYCLAVKSGITKLVTQNISIGTVVECITGANSFRFSWDGERQHDTYVRP